MANNLVCWMDMPVKDLDRSVAFYSAVLDRKLEKQEFEGTAFAFFAHEKGDMAGCLIEKGEGFSPMSGWPLVYFDVNGRLDQAQTRVEELGGTIEQAKHAIGPHGFRSIIKDSEGNRVALHSEVE